ncbi:MAG: MATE family efflux transporter [Clostridia bacterium]|nr:MATE family efflux transporter [Clostridia bacterium]
MDTARPKRYGMDLTQGNILRQLIIFMLPLLAANIVQQLYNTVDMIVIGHFVGSQGTVGVAVGGQAAQFLTMISMGMAIGGQVYVSQLTGAGQREKINDAIGTLFSFVLIISLSLMALGLVFSNTIVELMNTPPEAVSETSDYMRITFLGFPFIFGYNAVCSVLRGMGDSRRPLIFVIVAAVSNIIFDLILVAWFDMAAAGTAIATVVGQAMSFLFAIVFLYRRRENFGFDFRLRSFMIRWEHLRVFLKLGLPEIVRSACIQLTVIYVNSLINAYGLVASATNSVGNKITQLANTITMSMNQGCSAMIGQNLAAGKQERAKKVVYTGLSFALILAAINSVLALTVPKLVFSIFTNDAEVIEFGVVFMRVAIIIFFLSALMGPTQSMVTGSGFAILGLAVGILDGVVFRLLFSYLFADLMGMGVVGYFLASALGRLGPVLICGGYFLSGKWRTRKLLVKRGPAAAQKQETADESE